MLNIDSNLFDNNVSPSKSILKVDNVICCSVFSCYQVITEIKLSNIDMNMIYLQVENQSFSPGPWSQCCLAQKLCNYEAELEECKSFVILSLSVISSKDSNMGTIISSNKKDKTKSDKKSSSKIEPKNDEKKKDQDMENLQSYR